MNDNPGTIEIKGKRWSSNSNCEWGGLLLHCTANDTSSPWHNFVSDDINWKDNYGKTPCVDDGGMMESEFNIIKYLKSVGAKKIWANRRRVTLIGTPKRAEKGMFPSNYYNLIIKHIL